MESSSRQPAGLLSVLLDTCAEDGDRDDAAMDLSAYDEPEVEQGLFRVALDPQTVSFVADTIGESIAEIWCRKNRIDLGLLRQLPEPARNIAVAVLRRHKPEWGQKIAEVMLPPS
jgi:hypothetical protein